MKFLAPIGGFIDHDFGLIVTPSRYGVSSGIYAGMVWGGDNECFTKEFDWSVFSTWLEKMKPYQNTCLFICVPDVVGNAQKTIKLFEFWRDKFAGWPLAFVAQDGMENLPFPEGFSTLFLGGSTAWKMGDGAKACIERAQKAGKHIHIGRVNYWKRYEHFRGMPGSDEFTCDGTRTRYEGSRRSIAAWKDYMKRPYTRRIF